MDCPVCQRRALAPDATACPQCDTDLRGLRLLAQLQLERQPAPVPDAGSAQPGPRRWFRLPLALAAVALLGAGVAGGRWWSPGARPVEQIPPATVSVAAAPAPLVAGLLSARDSLRRLQQVAAVPPAGGQRAGFTYVVRRGDTLRGIAWRLYGRAALAERLQAENGIKNPRRLRVGSKLQLFSL